VSLKKLLSIKRICATCGVPFVSGHSFKCVECMLARCQKNTLVEEDTGKAQIRRGELKAKHVARAKKNAIKTGTDRSDLSKARQKSRLKKESTDTKRAYPTQTREARKNSRGITCILCGTFIPSGQLLEHKEKFHGERQIPRNLAPTRTKRSTWVKVISGGLPSLGKK
jgi:hypothetical protein